MQDGHPTCDLRTNADRETWLQRLRADQAERWRRGERVLVERYAGREPDLATDAEALLDLIYSEVVLREECGERPTLEEYLRRFPDHEASLRRQFDLHDALGHASAFESASGAAPTLPPRDQGAAGAHDVATSEPPTLPPRAEDDSQPVPRPTSSGLPACTAEETWPHVAGYEIFGVLGRGGMGVVYKARHLKLRRLVALKMLLAGSHAGPEELARFRTEAEAVARLQHPNIVQIYEVGEQDGLSYFSLEFVDCGSLDKQLNGTPLDPRKAAALVETLARAMHTAHQQGIIHRDLKPANILLLRDEGRGTRGEGMGTKDEALASSALAPRPSPLAPIPKITDFGLAKKLDDAAGRTASGVIMGTPSYMAPEQAGGKHREVGPAADIYALGAILYECLTGRPPFRAATPLDTVLQVLNDEPVPLRQLQSKTPRDLETICLKCLHKEPTKRYASARELADDLGRFLRDESIQARPVGRLEWTRRWCRKNKALATTAVVVPLVLIAGSMVSTLFGIQSAKNAETADRNAETARQAELRATENARQASANEQATQESLNALQAEKREHSLLTYASQIGLARSEWNEGNAYRARQLIEETPPELRGWEWYFLKGIFRQDSRTLEGHSATVIRVACGGPDRAATLDLDGTVRVWNLRTGVGLKSIMKIPPAARLLAMSPDGQRLALGADDQVVIFAASSGRRLADFRPFGLRHPLAGLAFVKGGQELAVCSQTGAVRFLDAATWRERRRVPKKLDLDSATPTLVNQLQGVTFSPDGSRIGQGSMNGRFHVWDAATGDRLLDVAAHFRFVGALAFSPDGQRVASPGGEGTISVWDIARKQMVQQLRGHRGVAWTAAFSPDGKRLVSGGSDATVRLWDPATGECLRILRGHTGVVLGVAFAADGHSLVTISEQDLAIRVWDIAERHTHLALPLRWLTATQNQQNFPVQPAGPGMEVFYGHASSTGAVALSPDGQYLATADMGNHYLPYQVVVWRLADQHVLHLLSVRKNRLFRLAFDPASKSLAVGMGGGDTPDPAEVLVFDVATGKRRWHWQGPPDLVTTPTFLADGTALVVTAAGKPSLLLKLDAATGKEMLRESVPPTLLRASLTPQGDWVTAIAETATVQVRDGETGKVRQSWPIPRRSLSDVECSRQGIIAAAEYSWLEQRSAIQLIRLSDGQRLQRLEGHTGRVLRVAFSPDGQRLASVGADTSIRLWDVRSGHELLTLDRTLPEQGHPSGDVSWSGDGSQLAASGKDRPARLWQVTLPRDDATTAWTELFRAWFAPSDVGSRWKPDGGDWSVRDGILVGKQTAKTGDKGEAFNLAQGTLEGVDLPTTFELRCRFRVSQPMTVAMLLSNARGQGAVGPMVFGGRFPYSEPGLILFHVGLGQSYSTDGILRKVDLEPRRWHEARLLRQPTLLRFYLDGQERMVEPVSDLDMSTLLLQGSWSNPGDEIEFADLVIRAPAEAIREQKLRSRISKAFKETGLLAETRRRIEATGPLSAADRALLDRVLAGEAEDATVLEQACRAVVERTNAAPAELDLARRQAEALVRIEPNNAHFVAVLCLAQYRGGHFAEAVKTMERALSLTREVFGLESPIHLAILAMALHKAGQKDAALDQYQKAQDYLLSDHWTGSALARRFLHDAEAVLGESVRNRQPNPDAEAIKRLLTRSLQDGGLKHDLPGYLAAFATETSVRTGRDETPWPSDVVLNRAQLEACRRIEFASPLPVGMDLYFTDVQVKIQGDKAEARLRSIVSVLGTQTFQVHGHQVRLKQTPAGWRITELRSWPIAEKTADGRQRRFDAAEWTRLDQAVARLNDQAPLLERLQALQEALRFAEADQLLRQHPLAADDAAALWCEQGKIAFQLGRVDEALAAFQRAKQKDSKVELPWYITPNPWKVLATDAFPGPALGKLWMIVGGQWSVAEGAAHGTLHGPAKLAQIALKKILPATAEVSFDCWADEGVQADAIFVNLQRQGVAVSLRPKSLPGGGGLVITQLPRTPLAVDASFDFRPGQHYQVRVARQPGRVAVFVDGVERLAKAVPDLKMPTLVLQGSHGPDGSRVHFAKVVVRAPEPSGGKP